MIDSFDDLSAVKREAMRQADRTGIAAAVCQDGADRWWICRADRPIPFGLRLLTVYRPERRQDAPGAAPAKPRPAWLAKASQAIETAKFLVSLL